MVDSSDMVAGNSEIGEQDFQDLNNDLTAIERQILPNPEPQIVTQRGEIEKLARFFSELAGTDEQKSNFFGFINHIHQYGFYSKEDIPILLLMYDINEASYKNSLKSWEYTRKHSVLLNNIRVLFYSIIRSAIGTKDNVINTRTALNEMRINRQFGEFQSPKKRWFNF